MALLLEDLNDLFTVVGNEKLDPENNDIMPRTFKTAISL